MIPAAWLARERPPGRGGPRWCRVESVAAQRRSGRGGGDLHAKPLGFAFDALVAPARMLGGQPDDQLLHVRVRWRRPVWRCGSVHAPATSRRCQRSRVSGLTRKHDQRALGSTRLTAASRARPGRFQPGTRSLAAEHGELVAENKEFQVLGSIAAGEQGQELDGAAQGQVGEFRQHQVTSAVGSGSVTVPSRAAARTGRSQPHTSLRTQQGDLRGLRHRREARRSMPWTRFSACTGSRPVHPALQRASPAPGVGAAAAAGAGSAVAAATRRAGRSARSTRWGDPWGCAGRMR